MLVLVLENTGVCIYTDSRGYACFLDLELIIVALEIVLEYTRGLTCITKGLLGRFFSHFIVATFSF